MKLYKLTDKHGRTKNGMLWEVGCTNFASGNNPCLCTDGVLHAYKSPLISIFLNPLHADFRSPRLFLCEGDIVAHDNVKVGSRSLTCVAELDAPRPSRVCRITFAALCLIHIFKNEKWQTWAKSWISGEDRSVWSAVVASRIAYASPSDGVNVTTAAGAVACAAAGIADSAAAAAHAAYVCATVGPTDLETVADMAFKITTDGA